jgi:hypothetical protein
MNFNLKSFLSKPYAKALIIVVAIAILIPLAIVAAAAFTYTPSNDLTLKEKATVAPTVAPTQTPIVVHTVLTADKTGQFTSGDTLDLIATLSQPQAGVTIAFQEVNPDGSLGGPGYATTNAQGVATFHFTPSTVAQDTDRTFRATPQG